MFGEAQILGEKGFSEIHPGFLPGGVGSLPIFLSVSARVDTRKAAPDSFNTLFIIPAKVGLGNRDYLCTNEGSEGPRPKIRQTTPYHESAPPLRIDVLLPGAHLNKARMTVYFNLISILCFRPGEFASQTKSMSRKVRAGLGLQSAILPLPVKYSIRYCREKIRAVICT